MKQSNYGEWVRSSSTPSRAERLKAHEEFEASELKKMLDSGWKITSAKKAERPRRPRIEKERKTFKLFGTLECRFEIPFEILVKAGFAK